MTDEARPQDVGRSHRRRGKPSPETASLLGTYRTAMRDELRAALAELKPVAPPPGLGLVADAPKRPGLDVRIRLWDLAIKLGRELGAEVDEPTAAELDAAGAPRRPARRARVDYGA